MHRGKWIRTFTLTLLAASLAMCGLPAAARGQYADIGLYQLQGIKYSTGSPAAATAGQVLVEHHVLLAQTNQVWLFTGPGNPVDLTPAGFDNGIGYAMTASQQVGAASNIDLTTGQTTVLRHAFLWSGTAASGVDLNPAGYTTSQARGIGGNQQVGSAYSSAGVTQAFVWSGSAASAQPLDLTGFQSAVALATNGVQQVGMASNGSSQTGRAVLWNGPGSSIVDLHPGGYASSEALAVGGGQIVGDATTLDSSNNPVTHAMLWTGPSAADAIDLTPTINGAPFTFSTVLATNGTIQVGVGVGPFGSEALLWYGSAASVVQLGLLQTPFSIDATGNIFGASEDGFSAYASEWTPVPEPALGAAIIGALALFVRPRCNCRKHLGKV